MQISCVPFITSVTYFMPFAWSPLVNICGADYSVTIVPLGWVVILVVVELVNFQDMVTRQTTGIHYTFKP